MELWIRSQNKKKLTKITNITLDNDETGILQDDECIFELLGTYKTKERALEVLNEIHQRLVDIQTFEHMIGDTDLRWLQKRAIDCVYIMPKE